MKVKDFLVEGWKRERRVFLFTASLFVPIRTVKEVEFDFSALLNQNACYAGSPQSL